MEYFITAVVIVLVLIPLAYELPNYVYGRKYAVLPVFRWKTYIYAVITVLLFVALISDGIIMINLTGNLDALSIRLWIGIVICITSCIYFLRLIPVYYDDAFDVRSRDKITGVFVRELAAIIFFSVGLFCVSVYDWCYVLDGLVTVLLVGARSYRYYKLRTKR